MEVAGRLARLGLARFFFGMLRAKPHLAVFDGLVLVVMRGEIVSLLFQSSKEVSLLCWLSIVVRLQPGSRPRRHRRRSMKPSEDQIDLTRKRQSLKLIIRDTIQNYIKRHVTFQVSIRVKTLNGMRYRRMYEYQDQRNIQEEEEDQQVTPCPHAPCEIAKKKKKPSAPFPL